MYREVVYHLRAYRKAYIPGCIYPPWYQETYRAIHQGTHPPWEACRAIYTGYTPTLGGIPGYTPPAIHPPWEAYRAIPTYKRSYREAYTGRGKTLCAEALISP